MAGDLQETLDYNNNYFKKRKSKMETMITIGYVAGMIVAGALGFVITYVKTRQGRKTAVETVQTEADEAKALAAAESAKNAVDREAERLIVADELDFSDLDGLLQKTDNGTAGSIKFRMVLQALHLFCVDHGIQWNEEAMTELIKNKVAFTKVVNAPTKNH